MSIALPVLYTFRRCPYAIRARLALRGAGIAVEAREIALRDKPAALREISPKATVPVLQLPDGRVLEQSLDIMRWALERHDPDGWLAAAPWVEQRRWIDLNDGEFKRLLDRYKYPERHPGVAQTTTRDAAVAVLLAPLESSLSARPFICGDRRGVADMALLPFVRQFAAVDPAWWDGSGASAPLPALRAWLAAGIADPLFEAVMAKLPVWQPR